MYKIIDFNNWDIDEESPFGSGASEKMWLVNKDTNQKGVFKYPKTHVDSNNITGEYWAEKLASDIAKAIGLECANVDIGEYENRRGSMSYMILNKNEELIEGVIYIAKKFPYYNSDKFKDEVSGELYSIQMIMKSLEDTNLGNDFLKIPIFDYIIGNRDRHHSNWGIIKNIENNEIRISPLYDNGSSLCCYIDEDAIDTYLTNNQRFYSLTYGKSISIIRWRNIKKVRHFEMMDYLKHEYHSETYTIVKRVKEHLTDTKIREILSEYSSDIINDKLKELLEKVLINRRQKLIELYEL